jgi:hypothetical protein
VEVGETYVGGKRKGYGSGYRGNKVVIAGPIERGGEVRLRLVPNSRRHNLEGFIEGVAGDDASIFTDEPASCQGIAGIRRKARRQARRPC